MFQSGVKFGEARSHTILVKLTCLHAFQMSSFEWTDIIIHYFVVPCKYTVYLQKYTKSSDMFMKTLFLKLSTLVSCIQCQNKDYSARAEH